MALSQQSMSLSQVLIQPKTLSRLEITFFRFQSEAERGLITLEMDSYEKGIYSRANELLALLLRKCIKNSRENE